MIYFQAHYSIAKGACFLGFGESNVVRVETDKIGMMKPDVLDQKIQECIQQVSIMFKVRKTRKNTH